MHDVGKDAFDDPLAVAGFPSGTLFAERYRIDALLGTGAMGKVFRALDTTDGSVVALKVLHADKARKELVHARFLREAEILAALGHPGIVRIVTSGRSREGIDYLVMELLVGQTLRERLKAIAPKTFAPREFLPILLEIADALGAAHQGGVVHRDLKPDNVFLVEEASSPVRVKILDFGLSMLDTDKRMTKTGVMLGTPRYMAPEQIRSAKDVDPRVDVYALGVITHEVLAGSSPFPATDAGQLLGCVMEGRIVRIEELRPDLPEGLGDVIRRAMHKDRRERFATIAGFAEAFARVLGVTLIGGRISAEATPPPHLSASGDSADDEPQRPTYEPPKFTAARTPSPSGSAMASMPEPKPRRSRLLLAIFVCVLVLTVCAASVLALGLRTYLERQTAIPASAPAGG